MNTEIAKPSLWKIATSDYAACLCLFAPVGAWVAFAFVSFGIQFRSRSGTPLGTDFAPWLMIAAIVLTVIGLPLFIWRWRSIVTFYQRATTVIGTVTKFSFVGKTVMVIYEYEFNDAKHESFASMPVRRAGEFSEGMKIALLVDQARPDNSMIKSHFA